jgi:hypothetical protein
MKLRSPSEFLGAFPGADSTILTFGLQKSYAHPAHAFLLKYECMVHCSSASRVFFPNSVYRLRW